MHRRMAFLLTPFLLFSLIGAGCGGGGSTDTTAASTPATASSASSGDVATILASIKPVAQQGPQKIALNAAVVLDGALKDPTVGALLGNGPIALNLSGPVDATGKAADLAFDVKAGKINLAGGLRLVGDKAFLKLGDKWYELPADSFTTSGSTGSIDVAKALEALGDPSALIKNGTVVGSEVIDGIDTDHIAGDVDTAELVKAIARVAATVDTSSSPIDASQITQATAKLEQFVKNAEVELWVGKDDKQVHRFKVNLDAILDAETKASSGLNGVNLDLALTSTPTDSPNVETPSGALPASQLQTDIGPIILAGLGGASTTP